jgi:hypothetical protein
MDHESLIFFRPQNLIEKRITRIPFLPQDISLAHAGIDEKTERQRQIGFLGEIRNLLGPVILSKHKVVGSQTFDDLVVFIPHRCEDTDDVHIGRERRILPGILLSPQWLRRQTKAHQRYGSSDSK